MLDNFVSAQFADGHVVKQDGRDQSAFEQGRNVMYDIVQRLHEPKHGPLQKFMLTIPSRNEMYVADYTGNTFPEHATPVRDMRISKDWDMAGNVKDMRCHYIEFGVEWEEDGQIIRDVVRID